MRKNILVVINSLQQGGAEKSCVNFLNSLPENKYEVDLMLLSHSGIFLKEVPKWVNLIEAPLLLSCLSHSPKEWKYYIKLNPAIWFKKIKRTWKAKRQSELSVIQSLWHQWESDIPIFKKKYDAAIGEALEFCNYFVLTKTNASRKIIWIHTDYDKYNYNPMFDISYFSKADIIATMSQIAKENLQKTFPNLASRILFIENITNVKIVREMANIPIYDDAWKEFLGLKIISCGRLEPVKSYKSAIMAATLIKRNGIPFKWILIGDGSERRELQSLKKRMNLDKEFLLVGMRENPYPYIKRADMLVVTSLYEGRSMVIDEAKSLGIPTITTNYSTATNAVEHEETGLICDMTPKSIAQAIIRIYKDKALYQHIRKRLSDGISEYIGDIDKHIAVIEGNL